MHLAPCAAILAIGVCVRAGRCGKESEMSRRVPVRLWTTLALGAATVAAAHAETTFVLTIEMISCVEVSWHPGAPNPSEHSSLCFPSLASPFEIGVFQLPGTTDFSHARHLTYTFNYTYSDDGLAAGNGSFESATLSFRPQVLESSGSFATSIDVFGAPADAFAFVWGGPRGTALVLGDNDHPDSFSGRLRVELHPSGGSGSTWIGGLEPVLSLVSVPDGGVPPIPEPSTIALMLAGLGAIGVWAQRKRAANDSA
jgi:hypothetical protein